MLCAARKRTQDTYRERDGPVFLGWQQNAPKLFAPRNRFSLDRSRIINALYYFIIIIIIIIIIIFFFMETHKA